MEVNASTSITFHRFFRVVIWLVFFLWITLVSSEDIFVEIGGSDNIAGPKFDPEFVFAHLGDIVHFTFTSPNHTVTQSTFEKPCTRAPFGFDTGFVLEMVTFPLAEYEVVHSKPVWIHSKQGNDCQEGMVFAINPENESQFENFKANAIATAHSNEAQELVPYPDSSSLESSMPSSESSAPAAEKTASSEQEESQGIESQCCIGYLGCSDWICNNDVGQSKYCVCTSPPSFRIQSPYVRHKRRMNY